MANINDQFGGGSAGDDGGGASGGDSSTDADEEAVEELKRQQRDATDSTPDSSTDPDSSAADDTAGSSTDGATTGNPLDVRRGTRRAVEETPDAPTEDQDLSPTDQDVPRAGFGNELDGGQTETRPYRGELRAVRQDQRRQPTDGETFLDEQIGRAEEATGVDIPGEGDVVQSVERDLSAAAAFQRRGRGILPSAPGARRTVRESSQLALVARGVPESVASDVGGRGSDDAPLVGAAGFLSQQANPAGIVLGTGRTIETGGEFLFNVGASQLPSISDVDTGDVDVSEGAGPVANLGDVAEDRLQRQVAAAEATASAAAESTAESARERPFETLGSAVGWAALLGGEVAAGRAAGRVGRLARDRVRTAGGTRVDARDLTNERVIRNVESGGAQGEQFPGAADPGLYRSDPAAAVRQQADEFTPPEVDELFTSRGAPEGTTLKKAVDVEPEGPGGGRSAQGFESPEAPDGSFDYESPGSFFGPELSPNFLRIGGRSRLSLRPGLPDFGGRPTGVVARTDVENTRASTLEGFNRELVERAGDPTALAKPSSAVNVGEIEAVVPPGAAFRDVGGSLPRNLLRRAGVGADLYTEIAGRRVPLRPVVPDTGSAGGRGAVFTGRSLDDVSRPGSTPVDRPLPAGSLPNAGTDPGAGSSLPEAEFPDGPRGSSTESPESSPSSSFDADFSTVTSQDSDPRTSRPSDAPDSRPSDSGRSGREPSRRDNRRGSSSSGGSSGGSGSPGGSSTSQPPGSSPPASSGSSQPPRSRAPPSGGPRGIPGLPSGPGSPSSPGSPRPRPTTPSDLPELDFDDPDDDERRDDFLGLASPEFTDFYDPLFGGVLETDTGTGASDPAPFLPEVKLP